MDRMRKISPEDSKQILLFMLVFLIICVIVYYFISSKSEGFANKDDFKSEKEIIELLKQVGLDHKWNQLCGNLSLGQQQRIAITRALLQPADFLIMDEPFSHLDDVNTNIAMNLIQNHCIENNIGIILTTLGQQYTVQWHKKVRIA